MNGVELALANGPLPPGTGWGEVPPAQISKAVTGICFSKLDHSSTMKHGPLVSVFANYTFYDALLGTEETVHLSILYRLFTLGSYYCTILSLYFVLLHCAKPPRVAWVSRWMI